MPQNNSPEDTESPLDNSRYAPDMLIAHEVADLISHMIGDKKSIIEPSTLIWTTEAAEELRSRVGDNPIVGSDQGQWEKLDKQLEGAPREVVLLAAEIVFLREHALRSARPETRRNHVERVLRHLDNPVEISAPMDGWLDRPAGEAGLEPGSWYHGSMWRHLIWTATFVRHWNTMSDAQRQEALVDPWKLQQAMLESGDDRSDIRNILQFLARPEIFEPISSAQMKKKIRDELAERIGGSSGDSPSDLDHDLLAIRVALTLERDGPFHFWSPGIKELWSPEDTAPSEPGAGDDSLSEPRPRHYWLYSPGRQASEWGEFSSDNIMAIGWDHLGDLALYSSREEIRTALDTDGSGQTRTNAVLALWQFQNEMAIGDIVFAKRGRREIVGRGEVISEPRFEPSRDIYQHVRSVKWTHIGEWEHPGEAILKTLTDITADHDYVEKLEALVTDEADAEPVTAPRVLPAYGRAAFLTDVYMTEARYERLRSLLARKKNVILAGPPGVGKTYAAKRLAYSIMGEKDPDRVNMVQFHQSYSYEDFMMGFRPTEAGGFVLTEGPFYRFCEKARASDEDKPFYFIIDEINRGNISKIFGELLMLIEADKRGQELRLLYKNETFSIPPNVHIIGMMNTADRSIAFLDYALRRRFGFFEMSPGFDSAGFAKWQQEAGSPALDTLVECVQELNEAITNDPALGKGFAIGHSFLTKPSTTDETEDSWLHSVVEDELVPLLEEYWFDEPALASEWSERLRAAVA